MKIERRLMKWLLRRRKNRLEQLIGNEFNHDLSYQLDNVLWLLENL